MMMRTYLDISREYINSPFIPYLQLLNTKEWNDKRFEILIRDSHICQVCGKGPTDSQYHHESKKTIHFWFGEEVLGMVKIESTGEEYEDYFPKIIVAPKPYVLHVHHKFYILGKLPWQYSNDSLVTLCNWCHWQYHSENVVEVYKELSDKMVRLNLKPCNRCNGAGGFPEYDHVNHGVCFKCNGSRFENSTNL